jgi:hypothetical protein
MATILLFSDQPPAILDSMANPLYSLEVRTEALALLRSGVRNADVARKFGVPKGTVGAWKHYDRMRSGTLPGRHSPPCPRCGPQETTLDTEAYSYLLGLYLGDGCLCDGKAMREKGVYFLTIACADMWPGLMDECATAIAAVMPHNKVNRVQRPGMHNVVSFSKHWPCLFPQHGPGKKHKRAIILEPWQQEIVDEYPREFIRGLIHSDGCRTVNWTSKIIAGELKRYDYPRYHFKNESSHIRDLYTETLTKLGIEWRYTKRNDISVAKRASVAALDEFVGPKY